MVVVQLSRGTPCANARHRNAKCWKCKGNDDLRTPFPGLGFFRPMPNEHPTSTKSISVNSKLPLDRPFVSSPPLPSPLPPAPVLSVFNHNDSPHSQSYRLSNSCA